MPLLLNHCLKEECMETVRGWTDEDLRRLDEIIVEGERRFKERQPRSGALSGAAWGGDPELEDRPSADELGQPRGGLQDLRRRRWGVCGSPRRVRRRGRRTRPS